MKIKVIKHGAFENTVIYDGPALEKDYPVSDFFEVVSGSRGEGEGVNFRFGFGDDGKFHQVQCTLTYSETVAAYRSLVIWMDSIIRESKIEGEK